MAQWHPEIGETVGGYKVVELLGTGGLGIVFKVEREGWFFAMKFLRLTRRLDARAKREISILSRLDNPCVVRYVGSDFWPDPMRGHPYIVMEYVPGDTLEAFTLKHNPSARQATRIVLDVAQTLGEVHAEGVFHRDLKPPNIIIRGASERPVLIDFGIASLAGAPRLTGARLPQATEEFRAPEPLRFERDNPSGAARYEFGVSDELWALGVTFYWLLTDVLPFGEVTDEGGIGRLHERILSQRPIAPHLMNPRVPLAASRLCMKMLAELPGDRYPNVPELCSAFNETLTKAEDDASWDVPLVNPFDPQLSTTNEEPALAVADEVLRALHKRAKQRPRRGLVRPDEADPLPVLAAQVADLCPPAAAVEPDRFPPVEASQAAPAPGEHEPPVMAPPVPAAREQPSPPVTTTYRHRVAWRLGVVGTVLAMAAVALSVGANMGEPGSASSTSKAPPEMALQSTSPASGSTDGGVRGREVALDAKPLESLPGGDAAPDGAQLPASNANAMPRTPAQTPKNETPKTKTQGAGFRLPVKPAAVAVCALLDGGCTAPASQVRPEPPAISCPQDWRKTHERFNVTAREYGATVKGYKAEPGNVARVKDGPVTLEVDPDPQGPRVGDFPRGTLLLGRWQLGDNRLFGTFTEAKIPGEGTLPVCLVAGLEGFTSYVDEHGKDYRCPPGVGVCLTPGSTPDNAKTNVGVNLGVPTGQP